MTKQTSKFLSYVLRHRPDEIGIELDAAGWTSVSLLLEAMGRHGQRLTRAELEEVVRANDKQRFQLSDDGERIRANQGHSVGVDLGYQPAEPPEVLFHGTVSRFLPAIRATGLKKMKRHHVHLHAEQATAKTVGSRRGQPVILTVRAGAMHRAGHVWFVTPNRVWLAESIPVEFIDFP